jgi:hypothetical protein
MTSPVTHEAFIHGVRAIVAARLADDATRTRLYDAKLVYGSGERGTRGVCYFEAWQKGRPHDFLEVCATGEESPVQLAGTTIHELAHCLAGRRAGHGPDWKRACQALGLTVAQAAGQAYAPEQFAPEVWAAIAAHPVLTDGVPAFASHGSGPFLGLPVAPTPRPCPLGTGTRGGRSRGAGSGSRLRLWVCACAPAVRARVASDDSRAQCLSSGTAFSRPLKKAHLRRWRARAALRRTDQVRLAPRIARRLASGPF